MDIKLSSKRSQSALEYMMTYGWAILIIVIVAVILYSMGIFNPSSSVTFTSSGFSPFTVSSSLCNNLGYKIAIIAGPIPNNANYITINKVFVTSATGANTTTASYTLTNPVTLKSGQSATILIPNVACNSANTHYSLSAKIQYSYTASTLGLQTINTTGTVAGTSISGKPSVLTTYEPITITNTQSSATPSPFQQMINFTSSDPGFSSIATGNFGQNVEFFYYNGTVIPSWLENYTSTNAIWWLKIAAIPAGSSEIIYVGFASTLTNLFNTVNDGEAPQLSSTYAEYDDGANVFNYYTNFAGTSLPAGWTETISASGNSYSINNGLTLTANFSYTMVLQYSNVFNPQTDILDFYGYFENQGWGGVGYTPNGGYPMASTGSIAIGEDTPVPNAYLTRASGSTEIQIDSLTIGTTPYLFSMWESTSEMFGQANYQYTTPNSNGFVAETSLYPSIQLGQRSGTDYIFVQYLRVRAYPPNGVMPSVSFGSVQ